MTRAEDDAVARVTSRLRAALAAAMSSRDVTATAAIRSALSAIGNAGAVAGPAGPAPASSEHVAGSASGPGRAEVPRRQLSQAEVSRIAAAEIAEREEAAAQYDALGLASKAERLRREALVLTGVLGPEAGMSFRPVRSSGTAEQADLALTASAGVRPGWPSCTWTSRGRESGRRRHSCCRPQPSACG